jgi:hypothetical protein
MRQSSRIAPFIRMNSTYSTTTDFELFNRHSDASNHIHLDLLTQARKTEPLPGVV